VQHGGTTTTTRDGLRGGCGQGAAQRRSHGLGRGGCNPAAPFAVRQIPLSINDEFVDAVQIGVVLAAQVLLASLRPQGSPWLPRFVALATAWIGALVIIWPNDLTSPGRAWGIALICWALLFAVVNEQDQRNHHRRHRHRLSRHVAPGA
jgi:hypothetical protein